MDIILVLCKDPFELSIKEVSSFYNIVWKKDNFVCVKSEEQKEDIYKRFAYTKSAYKILFSCKKDDGLKGLKENVNKFDWSFLRSFAVRNINHKESEKELADLIPSYNVDLKSPDDTISFLFLDKIYCLKLLWKNPKTFVKSEPKFRPAKFPTTINSRLALGMVNLAGLKNGTIYDPFCGIGGILIEASLLGFKIKGNDISKEMLKGCKRNLEHYKIKKFKLTNEDALKQKETADAIVTDAPYGKNTKNIENLELFIDQFLDNCKKNNIKKIIIGIPYGKKITNRNYKIKVSYVERIHRSLSRSINVLEMC